MWNWQVVEMMNQVYKAFPIDVMKRAMDAFIDVLEDAVDKSESKWDNALVLPFLRAMRNLMMIPEFDLDTGQPSEERDD